MPQSRQHTAPACVKANGIELVYDSFGDQTKPAMLLIMGLGAQMVSWHEAFCGQLADAGFWVIRFDNRDVGLSQSLDEAVKVNVARTMTALLQGQTVQVPYLLSDMAADAVGLLDSLGIDAAHVVGASMGGMIAQTMAIQYPGRVRTLVSIMSTTGEPSLPQARPEIMKLLTTPAPLEREEYLDYAVRTWKKLSGPGFPYDENRVRTLAALVFERGLNPAGFGRQLAAILASGSRKASLKAVDIPALVIHGTADPLVPVEGGIDTAESIPGAELMLVEGMGHDLPRDAWPQLIEAITKHAN